MISVREYCAVLPERLDDADILVDCGFIHVDIVDLAQLVEELVVRRNARSFGLLGADAELIAAAKSVLEDAGLGERFIADPAAS